MGHFARVFIVVIAIAISVVADGRPASAELRFCNQTTNQSRIIEGHKTAHDGLEVKGLIDVPAGRCRVVVPGSLTSPYYFIRVINGGFDYGGSNNLCIMNTSDFAIADEDAPSFRCHPNESHLSLNGHAVKESMAGFMTYFRNGHATMVVTQRKDGASFHLDLK